MSRVVAQTLPDHSRLWAHYRPGDFLDCYAVESSATPVQAAEVITQWPGWVRWLLGLRAVVTAPFGLLQRGSGKAPAVGPFPIEHSDETEIVAGFDDRHLNFRICGHRANGHIALATCVHPHNLGGRAYLRLIMPFHIAIARDGLARVARAHPAAAV